MSRSKTETLLSTGVVQHLERQSGRIRPHLRRPLRILENVVDGLDERVHDVLDQLGVRVDEVVAPVEAVADVVPLLDRHDVLRADQDARLAALQGPGDVGIPGDCPRPRRR